METMDLARLLRWLERLKGISLLTKVTDYTLRIMIRYAGADSEETYDDA